MPSSEQALEPAPDRVLGQDLWRLAMDALDSQVALLDHVGVIVTVNDAWRRFAADGGSPTDFVGQSYLEACERPDDEELRIPGTEPEGEVVADGLRALLRGASDSFEVTYPCHSATTQRWFRMRAYRCAGSEAAVVVTHDDVSSAWRARVEAATSSTLLDLLDVAVVATDTKGVITYWNQGAEAIYGWTREEAVGAVEGDRVVAAGRAQQARQGASVPSLPSPTTTSESHGLFMRRDGSAFPGYERRSPRLDDGGRPAGTIAVFLDETDRVQAENYLEAVTDSMGEGLFALDGAGRVVFANTAAEELLGWSLLDIAGRALHELTHYRHENGGDYPEDECPILAAREFGTTVRIATDSFITRDGRVLPVSYTATPLRSPDGDKGCVLVFSDATHVREEQARLEERLEKLASARSVEEALREDRFLLYAQPIVDLRTGVTTQHELLLRVRERDGGICGPQGYLSAAEEHGLSGAVDRWVVGEAVALAARGGAVEVNISAASVTEPGLLEDIEAMLGSSGADPGLIVFEITETAVMADEGAGHRFVQRLHDLGCRVALDDFGTGYGGFTYLKSLPLDLLKIDMEFVQDLATNPASRHVVAAVVSLAAGFGLETVAEGVEDAATLELLRELGVDFVQGYHLGRPAPLAEVDLTQ